MPSSGGRLILAEPALGMDLPIAKRELPAYREKKRELRILRPPGAERVYKSARISVYCGEIP